MLQVLTHAGAVLTRTLINLSRTSNQWITPQTARNKSFDPGSVLVITCTLLESILYPSAVSCRAVNTILNSYFTAGIIIMLKILLRSNLLVFLTKMTIFVVWLKMSPTVKQNSVPAVMTCLLGSKATNRAEWSKNVQLYLQRKFSWSKNVIFNHQNIGTFSLYQQLVSTQITVLFLCYLFQNNCRNCGDVCWVYE